MGQGSAPAKGFALLTGAWQLQLPGANSKAKVDAMPTRHFSPSS